MKTIIVDDSRLARSELKRLLEEYPAIELCGEASNAHEARAAIEKYDPDIILLDIEMPAENGFELLASLDKVPEVIFTTAYDEFAVKAFEQNAIDYLVKPIEPDRLEKALEKAILIQQNKNEYPQNKIGIEDKVFVKDGNKCWFIKLRDVRFFETYGNYSRVYFEKEKPLINKPLTYLEKRLNPKKFFRANRQYIISLNHIHDISHWNHEAFRVTMSCGKKIKISRRKSQKFNDLLSF